MPKLSNNGQQHQHSSRHAAKPYDQKKQQSKSKRSSKLDNERLPTSLSACKKQLRDINRLLSKDAGLPSTKKIEFERRLKALNIVKEQLSNTQTNKANATRYHRIKFFERKKVLRKLTQAERENQEESSADSSAKIQELLINLNYTTYYPDEVKYISLYPEDPSKTPAEELEKQNKIRSAIRMAMEKCNLPKDPRLVSAKDRKEVRKNNRTLLRTVSLVNGKNDVNLDSDNFSASDNDRANESGSEKEDEGDEFFE